MAANAAESLALCGDFAKPLFRGTVCSCCVKGCNPSIERSFDGRPLACRWLSINAQPIAISCTPRARPRSAKPETMPFVWLAFGWVGLEMWCWALYSRIFHLGSICARRPAGRPEAGLAGWLTGWVAGCWWLGGWVAGWPAGGWL